MNNLEMINSIVNLLRNLQLNEIETINVSTSKFYNGDKDAIEINIEFKK